MPLQTRPSGRGFILSTIVLPPLIPVMADIAPRRPGVTLHSHFGALRAELRLALVQSGLMVVFLAHQAWLMGDAILRTLVRLTITRRRLLEWMPAAHAAFGRVRRLALLRTHGGAVVDRRCCDRRGVRVGGSGTWPLAVAFAGAWFVSPAVALRASLSPRVAGRRPLAEADAHSLRLVARQDVAFLRDLRHIGRQHVCRRTTSRKRPKPVVAHRTSPTNIGLYLLSVACARDFGWIGTLEAVERLEATLTTMARLAKHRGHFYNWYDTRDLRPLDPQYVSSVDSGNLAGHLIALANACREWRDVASGGRGSVSRASPTPSTCCATKRCRCGTCASHRPFRGGASTMRSSSSRQTCFRRAAGNVGVKQRLATLSEQAAILADAVREIALEDHDHAGADLQFWADAVRVCIDEPSARSRRQPLAALPARLLALGGDRTVDGA